MVAGSNVWRLEGRWRWSLTTSALVLSLLSSAAPAIALDMTGHDVSGRRVLLLEGKFLEGDGQRLEQLLRRNPLPQEGWLHSGGGIADEGLRIGRLIRRAGLSTRIPKGASCASACADAFMGGVARRVDEGGRYGIHMATASSNPKLIEYVMAHILKAIESYDSSKRTFDPSSAKKIIRELEQSAAVEAALWGGDVLEMGGSARIVELGTKTEVIGMNWLTRRQMVNLNDPMDRRVPPAEQFADLVQRPASLPGFHTSACSLPEY